MQYECFLESGIVDAWPANANVFETAPPASRPGSYAPTGAPSGANSGAARGVSAVFRVGTPLGRPSVFHADSINKTDINRQDLSLVTCTTTADNFSEQIKGTSRGCVLSAGQTI